MTNQQRTLAESTSPITVAIAGPGSGKTHTLIGRYAQMTNLHTVIITFTNQAARELIRRIHDNNLPLPEFVGTLHAYALRTLRRNRPVTMLSEEESEPILKEALDDLRSKLTTAQVRGALRLNIATQQQQVAIMRYRAKLAIIESEDNDTLLHSFLEFIVSNGLQVGHLMVDEFQDSGNLDASIYDAIRAKHKFIVGDPDQAIYGFRGGDLRHLMRLTETPGVFTGFMESNFRSDGLICEMANRLMAREREPRLPKITQSVSGNRGAVEFRVTADEVGQWEAISQSLLNHKPEDSVAILCRTNKEKDAITTYLGSLGFDIPITKPAEIPSDWPLAKAALRLTADPFNVGAAQAFVRHRYSPDKAARLIQEATTHNRPLQPFACTDDTEFREWAETLKLSQETRAFLRAVLDTCPFDSIAAASDTLIMAMDEHAMSPPPAVDTGIHVMTIHGSKGLEFDRVILPSLTQANFKPSPEVRRLLFVAITRARHAITILQPKTVFNAYDRRSEPAEPSGFLRDIGLIP